MIYLDGVLYNELKKTRSAIEVRLSALDAAIESLQKTQASSLSKINDTYLVCKDILTGQQVSDWVADLKAYGTSSETYANSSRMTTLVNSSDAVGNSDVTKTILDWSLDNAMVGSYFGTLTGDTTVSWSALTTADALVSSEDALCGVIINDDTYWSTLVKNYTLWAAAKSKGALLESWFGTHPALLERFQEQAEGNKILVRDGANWSGAGFLYKVGLLSKTLFYYTTITFLDGTSFASGYDSNSERGGATTFNKFYSNIDWGFTAPGSSEVGAYVWAA